MLSKYATAIHQLNNSHRSRSLFIEVLKKSLEGKSSTMSAASVTRKKLKRCIPIPGEEQEKKRARYDPLEHLTKTRKKAGSELFNCDVAANYDIKQNILEIRAILKTNSEVLDRVIGSMSRSKTRFGSFACGSYSFTEVKTRFVNGETQFITNPQLIEKDFESSPLSYLPSDLNPNDMLRTPYTPCSTSNRVRIVDFETFFERSLLLHDDVLEPFLAKLKIHLMSVQVCLGKMDQWLMEVNNAKHFIETRFKTTLDDPDKFDNLEQVCHCPRGVHLDSDQCLTCKNPFKDHFQVDLGYSRKIVCPTTDQHFKCNKRIVLKKVHIEGCKIERTFDILKQSDKIKLEKFLDFADTAGEGGA